MRWRLFKLRRWLREWIDAAPKDDFWRLYSYHHAAAHSINDSLRALADQQRDLRDLLNTIRDNQRLFALQLAKYDVEKLEAKHDAAKSA